MKCRAETCTSAGSKYDVILADPPWYYAHSTHKYELNAPYRLIPDDEMKTFRGVTDNLADPGVLFMWSTLPRLDFAFDVLQAWGLAYRGMPWIWVKTNKDGSVMGAKGPQTNTVKNTCEVVIAASHSKTSRIPKTSDQTIRNALFAQRREHSRKPDEVHEYLDRMYPDARKLELFARRKRPGWDVWGDEVESVTIRGIDVEARP